MSDPIFLFFCGIEFCAVQAESKRRSGLKILTTQRNRRNRRWERDPDCQHSDQQLHSLARSPKARTSWALGQPRRVSLRAGEHATAICFPVPFLHFLKCPALRATEIRSRSALSRSVSGREYSPARQSSPAGIILRKGLRRLFRKQKRADSENEPLGMLLSVSPL